MRTVWTIARRELKALFDHPVGYILLVMFVALTNFLFFRQAYLLGVASLRPMLDLLPWILLFVVPGATMRALAEDRRTGTLEVVLAQPVTEVELLAGKYLGQLLFLWVALALTIPVPLGLSVGADLAVGVVIAQYAGAALLVAGLAGVGLWASSITPNQITAFLVGGLVMFVLILLGAPMVTGLPPVLARAAASLSVLPHFENVTRGVMDLRDVIYFVSLAAVFLTLAYLAIQGRKLSPARAALRRLRLGTALLVAAIVAGNLFGRHIGGRLDLTPGKAYTLSRATKEILRGLDDLVTIKLFVSAELPPEVAIHRRDIDDLLSDMRAAARGNLRVVRADPGGSPDAESEARSLGIPPVQFNVIGQSEFTVREGYLGIAVQYADASETIPFVERTGDLEYRLVSYIRALTRTDTTAIAFVSGGNPTLGESFRTLREQLAQSYAVRDVRPAGTAELPEARVIVLAGVPDAVPDTFVTAVRDFVTGGGAALVLASGARLQPQAPFAAPRPVPWNRVLEPYGVRIEANLAYDLASNERVTVPAQQGPFRVVVSYPLWVRALSTRAVSVNQDLESVLLPWPSTIDTAGAAPGTVTPLFTTSRAGGLESGQAFIAPVRDSWPTDDLAPRLLAVLVNPLGAAEAAEAPEAADAEERPRGRLVVVANETFITDRFVENASGGLLLALNAVDWLAQEDALITIRAKDRSPPTLVLTGFARDAVKWGNVIGVPLLVILFAGVRLWRRRRRTHEHYRPAGAAAAAAEAA